MSLVVDLCLFFEVGYWPFKLVNIINQKRDKPTWSPAKYSYITADDEENHYYSIPGITHTIKIQQTVYVEQNTLMTILLLLQTMMDTWSLQTSRWTSLTSGCRTVICTLGENTLGENKFLKKKTSTIGLDFIWILLFWFFFLILQKIPPKVWKSPLKYNPP